LPVAAFLRVELQAPTSGIDQLDRFYAEQLELARLGEHRFPIGESELVFGAGAGEPFYHVALLVPGDRFAAALRWARTRVALLPGGDGDFAAAELVGVSEVGLVGDPEVIAKGLTRLELRLWDGQLGPRNLAFVGERGRTLILSPEGRGWLPTRRPAEPFPVHVHMTGPPEGEVAVGAHRVRRGERPSDSDGEPAEQRLPEQ
jgi:hypothetical protein